MRPLQKKILHWKGTFRALNRSDLLLLYAGPVPGFGSALWHSHSQNHVPHVHIEAGELNEERAQERHRHRHDLEDHQHNDYHRGDDDTDHPHNHHGHEDSTDDGHWHFVVPAEALSLSQQLLVFAVCEVWVVIHDLACRPIGCRSAFSARAPPPLVSPS